MRRAPLAGLDRVVERVEGPVRGLHADHQPVRRVPGRDGRPLGRFAAGGDLHPGRELPGRRLGGDRGPDVLRRGGQVDLAGDLELTAHDSGSLPVGDGGVQRDDEPVRTPARRGLVVVLGYEAVDRRRQLDGERRAVLRGGESHLAVDPERRERLAGRARRRDRVRRPRGPAARPVPAASAMSAGRARVPDPARPPASADGEITYDAAVAWSTRSVQLPLRRSSTSSTSPCRSSARRW